MPRRSGLIRFPPRHFPAAIGRAFRVSVVVATLVLTGCNANQEVNPSSRTATGVVSGRELFRTYNPYNPISYAQNNTGIGGGR